MWLVFINIATSSWLATSWNKKENKILPNLIKSSKIYYLQPQQNYMLHLVYTDCTNEIKGIIYNEKSLLQQGTSFMTCSRQLKHSRGTQSFSKEKGMHCQLNVSVEGVCYLVKLSLELPTSNWISLEVHLNENGNLSKCPYLTNKMNSSNLDPCTFAKIFRHRSWHDINESLILQELETLKLR